MGDIDKTKEQLINELDEARQRVAQLETLETERKRAEHDLNERVKELKCLHDITSIAARRGITFDEISQEVANLLPAAWQYPEIASARIIVTGKEFKAANYRETEWKQCSEIKVDGEKKGIVEVNYLEERPVVNEGPFLKEERLLIDAVAETLGRMLERKRAEEALRESESFLNSIIEQSPFSTWISDDKGTNIRQNQACRELFGIKSDEEVVGKYNLFEDEEVRRQGFIPLIQEVFSKGKVVNFVIDYDFKKVQHVEVPGATHKILDVTIFPIKDANGKVTNTVVQHKDITERKQAEEREEELHQELYVSSRLAAVGELAAGVAHEINNPLTGVLGFSERLLRKSTDEKFKQGLELIHNEAQRAARVVQNLLTFARRRGPAKEHSDINDILQRALELRAYELQTSNIEVATDLAPSLPGIMVDFNQIEEVFLNIILNAEQVMTEAHGGGKLTIKTQETKDHVRISFSDDGPGIPAGQLNRVFDPFFTTRREKGGTGLGLGVCHGIVTEHGGRIHARSKPGKGATFFVELPCA